MTFWADLSFFDEAVDLIVVRITARMEQQDPGTETSAEAIRDAIQAEAQKLRREIKELFMATGKLDLPEE